jgi:hypothetical protein
MVLPGKNRKSIGGAAMGERQIKAVKREVKKEFKRRKKQEEHLKLTRVYEEYSRRAGFRNWYAYRAVLDRLSE